MSKPKIIPANNGWWLHKVVPTERETFSLISLPIIAWEQGTLGWGWRPLTLHDEDELPEHCFSRVVETPDGRVICEDDDYTIYESLGKWREDCEKEWLEAKREDEEFLNRGAVSSSI